MKLVSLEIKGLYGSYNYSVNFNNDVTFIYGSNGCGKTTVLNITEIIITGQLYKLFSYSFSKITLEYSPTGKKKEASKIEIELSTEQLYIKFNSEKFELSKDEFWERLRESDRDHREVARIYYSKYAFLSSIRDTFNYVYLPLNRSANSFEYDETEMFMRHKIRGRSNSYFVPSTSLESKDRAMIQVESLIQDCFSRINSKINHISDDFRNEILKSSVGIEISNKKDEQIDIQAMQDTSIDELQSIKEAYIKMLKELKLLSVSEEDQYNSYFNTLTKDFKIFKQGEQNISLELFLRLQGVLKVKKLVSIAEGKEKEKAMTREPIELFLNIMNDFINDTDEGKKIVIDPTGSVYFTTGSNIEPISIHYLSSGEKQLITFFANLIFKVKSSTPGIFVVDEPELSLHLSWQKIFVEKTMYVNNNIQLIFATHSPEIIGNQTTKTYKLVKSHIKSEIENNE